MSEHLRKLSPGRIVVLGFAFVILTGSLILWLPISANEGVHVNYIDSLFTSGVRDGADRSRYGGYL